MLLSAVAYKIDNMQPPTYAEAVAAEVRAELGRNRKKATDLAKHLNLSPQTALRRLSGESPFYAHELSEIATWLDIELDRLVKPNAGSAA